MENGDVWEIEPVAPIEPASDSPMREIPDQSVAS